MDTRDVIPEPDNFTSYVARVKKYATVAGILGGVLGLWFSIFIFFKVPLDELEPNRPGTAIKTLLVAPIVLFCILSAMATGSALLFAPSSFFTSVKGKEYLEKIGTQNVVVARVVILMFLLLGIAFLGLPFWPRG